MKKVFSVVIAIVLIFIFASCKQVVDSSVQQTDTPAPTAAVTPAPTAEPATQLPNPVVEVEDATDFYDLGFIITPHQQAASATYSIIDNRIAQIIFTLDGQTFTYRAAQTMEDISGVYEKFDALPQSLDLQGPGFDISVVVKTIDGGAHGALAEWGYEDILYSFYTPDPTNFDQLTDVLLPIIYVDLPFAACCG